MGHDTSKVETMTPVEDRLITVRFNADVHSSMRWNFRPQQIQVKVGICNSLTKQKIKDECHSLVCVGNMTRTMFTKSQISLRRTRLLILNKYHDTDYSLKILPRIHCIWKRLRRLVALFLQVAPGETALAFYTAKNPTEKPIVGISTYNIIPFEAGQYFNKIQVNVPDM